MRIAPGVATVAALLLGATLTLSACASAPEEPKESVPPAPEESIEFEPEAVWLDEGRLIGLVTWGSSSCVPYAGEATAVDQDIAVSLSDTLEGEAPRACTADMAPRVTVIGSPTGVTPKEDAMVTVEYNDNTLELNLDGEEALGGTPGDATEYLPSAAWLSKQPVIVLLTWGSSTCVPVAESIDSTESEVVATFATQDGPCTMDMVPRATLLGAEKKGDDQVLKLVGDNLDATVQLVG